MLFAGSLYFKLFEQLLSPHSPFERIEAAKSYHFNRCRCRTEFREKRECCQLSRSRHFIVISDMIQCYAVNGAVDQFHSLILTAFCYVLQVPHRRNGHSWMDIIVFVFIAMFYRSKLDATRRRATSWVAICELPAAIAFCCGSFPWYVEFSCLFCLVVTDKWFIVHMCREVYVPRHQTLKVCVLLNLISDFPSYSRR